MLATPTGYPFIQIFYNSTGSLAAANAMTSIIIIMAAFSCVTVMAGSSRQLFAFARDGALPFSPWVAYVSGVAGKNYSSDLTRLQVRPGLDVPVNAIIVIFVFATLISLINIGSTVAFNIVTSLGTGTLTASYIVCISCVVWRRLSGK